jgi:hypothetical protein
MDYFDLHAERSFAEDCVRLYAINRDGGKLAYVHSPCVTHDVAPGSIIEPMVKVSMASVQGLMEELWRMGVRPNNGEGGPAQVEAMKEHINDLRRMAFGRGEEKVNIEGPTDEDIVAATRRGEWGGK